MSQLEEPTKTFQLGDMRKNPDFPKIIDVSTDNETNDTYLKAFLIDDSINANFWHIPNEYMKKYANAFIGRPLIRHPSGNHPDYIKEGAVLSSENFIQDIFRIQDKYKIGEIVDVNYENRKGRKDKAWYATIRMTNPEVTTTLKSGASSFFVSPQIYDINGSEPNEPTKDFIPLHLAVVDEPAFGDRAKIRGICNGNGTKCINALRSAAAQVIDSIDNSSFFKKSPDGSYTLTNPNFQDPNQQYEQRYYRPEDYPYNNNNQNPLAQNQGQQQQNQVLNEKTQRQEVDANGNLITKTEDKKPVRGNNPNGNPNPQRPNTAQATQGQNPNQQTQVEENPQNNQNQNMQGYVPPQNPLTNPRTPQVPNVGNLPSGLDTSQINASDPQLPSALVNALKEIDWLKQQLGDVQKFKETEEQRQLKAASEQQKQLIESFLTPDLVPDENARQEMIAYFASLNLQDEDIKKLLELLVSGKFTAGSSQKAPPAKNPANVAQASADIQNKKVKGAALVMTNRSRSEPKNQYYARNYNSTFSNGFLTGVNPDDLSF